MIFLANGGTLSELELRVLYSVIFQKPDGYIQYPVFDTFSKFQYFTIRDNTVPYVNERPLHNGQHLEMGGYHHTAWLVSENGKILTEVSTR